jgi:LmbE family N-acetylglucosaminyl deacetylase
MKALSVLNEAGSPLRILCVGAHCDDIEIGCGGTLLHLMQTREVDISWVVFSSGGSRRQEAEASAREFLEGATSSRVIVKEHRDGFLPYSGAAVKEDFEELKGMVDPQLVFTHTRSDLHQDHRLLCELTWNTFRNHTILEYEIPKYDGDLGAPSLFVPLSEKISRRKVELLLKHYGSQAGKAWFTEDVFLALARLRGMECNAAEGLAEAFYSRKAVLEF